MPCKTQHTMVTGHLPLTMWEQQEKNPITVRNKMSENEEQEREINCHMLSNVRL